MYWKDLAEASISFTCTNFALLGAPRKMMSNKWKSVKVSITLSFLHKLAHKLINFHDPVKADHKLDLRFCNFRILCLPEQ